MLALRMAQRRRPQWAPVSRWIPSGASKQSIPDGGSRPADLRSAAVPVAAELIGADLTPPEDGGVERPGNVLRITPLPS